MMVDQKQHQEATVPACIATLIKNKKTASHQFPSPIANPRKASSPELVPSNQMDNKSSQPPSDMCPRPEFPIPFACCFSSQIVNAV
jgi:hypothetical protein